MKLLHLIAIATLLTITTATAQQNQPKKPNGTLR
jgi:hypothetical protein